MKKIFYTLAVTAFMFITSCVSTWPSIEEFPNEAISFKYEVADNAYQIDYLVGATIQFTNTSELQGNCTWDFGDGTSTVSDLNPTHIFQTAGTYTVKLTIEGQGHITKTIMISDIVPTIALAPITGGICEVNTTLVGFNIEVPNPQSLNVEYRWIFPDGTVDSNDNIITESTLADPGQVKFKKVGTQKVILQVTLGGRSLQESTINVQVGYTSAVKTLYYAVKGGNIMALKLINNLPAGISNQPFDLGVKSGSHPLNILFNDTSLYVLDAGKQFTYVNDVDLNLGDGKISVMSKDGSVVETMLSNSGGYAFNDPYYGYIDATAKVLYFSDRNTGISKISLDKRNQSMDVTSDPTQRVNFPCWVQNATLGYYKVTLEYGGMNANFSKVGNVWWWAKTYNGVGIFTFTESNILSSPISTPGTPPNPYSNADATTGGLLMSQLFIKSFVVDQPRGYIYLTVYDASIGGFYKIPFADKLTVNGTNITNYKIAELPPDTEGTTGEYVSVSQMVLDPEDGCVYFGFRTGDATKINSGLKRYNPATNKIESVIDGVQVYGVTINNTKSKLF